MHLCSVSLAVDYGQGISGISVHLVSSRVVIRTLSRLFNDPTEGQHLSGNQTSLIWVSGYDGMPGYALRQFNMSHLSRTAVLFGLAGPQK